MKRMHLLLTLVAAGHVALIACGAAQLLQSNSIPRPIRWYGAMTGADAGYGFSASTFAGSVLMV